LTLPNHYEFLQISPQAEADTIHRVYRFLAVRYHPDNPETGDPEKFFLLKQAYDVLSDPALRAAYDVGWKTEALQQAPISNTVDFMDNMDGELNRRLAALAVLYYRRRTTPDRPEVSLFELETRMGFPRDYLEFTIWYLQRKGYITRADNADFTITSDGVDFVETQRMNIPVLHKLLTSESGLNTHIPIRRENDRNNDPVQTTGMPVVNRRTRSDRRSAAARTTAVLTAKIAV
jgi:curved DNA-binding protein